MTYRKKLIEVALPLEAINEASTREKSIRHGHPSTLHPLFARRPLSAMRAAIFASLVPASGDEKERQQSQDLIRSMVDRDKLLEEDSPVIREAKDLIRQAYSNQPPKLLDPFMGGGSTGLEALRLGCDTYAVEIDPVAHLVELGTLVYPQTFSDKMPSGSLTEEVFKWGRWLLEEAKKELSYLYFGEQGAEEASAYIWAKTVRCPNSGCSADIPLMFRWWLVNKSNRHVALKPAVDVQTRRISFEILESNKSWPYDFAPNRGNYARRQAQCLVCGSIVGSDFLKTEQESGRIWGTPLVRIIREEPSNLLYRPITADDMSAIYNTPKVYSSRQAEAIHQSNAQSASSLSRWFNPRQSILFSELAHQNHRTYDTMINSGLDGDQAKAVATYLALAIDRLVLRNCLHTAWQPTIEQPVLPFGRPPLMLASPYFEVNPFASNNREWERTLNNITKAIETSSIVSTLPALVRLGSATQLPYPDDYFDVVVADPPHPGTEYLQQLNSLFSDCLRLSIGFLYPGLFEDESVLDKELFHSANTSASIPNSVVIDYEALLDGTFKEIQRVLRPEGIFVLLMSLQDPALWQAVFGGLLSAGLTVTSTWPLRTDPPSRIAQQTSNDATMALMSVFVIGRKLMEQDRIISNWERARAIVRAAVRTRLAELVNEGVSAEDWFVCAIGTAIETFGRFRLNDRIDEDAVEVAEIIDIVSTETREFAFVREHFPEHESVN